MEVKKEIDIICNEFPFVSKDEGPFVFHIKEEEIDITDNEVNLHLLLLKQFNKPIST